VPLYFQITVLWRNDPECPVYRQPEAEPSGDSISLVLSNKQSRIPSQQQFEYLGQSNANASVYVPSTLIQIRSQEANVVPLG
jgi:hypothetical protein